MTLSYLSRPKLRIRSLLVTGVFGLGACNGLLKNGDATFVGDDASTGSSGSASSSGVLEAGTSASSASSSSGQSSNGFTSASASSSGQATQCSCGVHADQIHCAACPVEPRPLEVPGGLLSIAATEQALWVLETDGQAVNRFPLPALAAAERKPQANIVRSIVSALPPVGDESFVLYTLTSPSNQVDTGTFNHCDDAFVCAVLASADRGSGLLAGPGGALVTVVATTTTNLVQYATASSYPVASLVGAAPVAVNSTRMFFAPSPGSVTVSVQYARLSDSMNQHHSLAWFGTIVPTLLAANDERLFFAPCDAGIVCSVPVDGSSDGSDATPVVVVPLASEDKNEYQSLFVDGPLLLLGTASTTLAYDASTKVKLATYSGPTLAVTRNSSTLFALVGTSLLSVERSAAVAP